MTEQIGLIADLDLSQWDLAVSRYLQSIEDMKNAAKGMAGDIGTGFSGLDGILSGVASSIGSAFLSIGETVLGALTSLAQQILANYQELGKNLLLVVGGVAASITGALAAAGKSVVDWTVEGIQKSTDFEQNMADIASVLRVTRGEVKPLADIIDQLALDPNLVVSTDQASQSVEQLARNGISMTDILGGAAKAAILLANATGTGPDSFSKAADIATMAMQMFNIKASDFNHIADVSQGVVNNSRIELDDWALALGNGGAAAGAFNVSLDDFATGIAATINLYHSARQAGTGLTNFLERLVPLTHPAAKEMRALGLFSGLTGDEFDKLAGKIDKTQAKITALDPTSKNYQSDLEKLTTTLKAQRSELNKGTNAFFDAQGNLKSLADVSETLRNATKDLSDEQQIEAFRRIFGNDALETAIGFANQGADAFNNLKDSIVIQNSAVDAAATRTKTLHARWENLQDIWSAIQRKSGAGFNDMLLKLVNRLTALTNANQDRIISFFASLAKWLSEVVDAAMPFIEKILPVMLDNIEALAYWLLELAKGGGVNNAWLNKMSPALRNIVTWIVKAVEGTINFVHWLIETGKAVADFLAPYIEWIKNNVTLKDVLIVVAGAITAYLLPAILRMASVAMLAISVVSSIRRAWETDWMGIRTFFEDLWPRIEGPLKEFVNGFLTGDWATAWEGAKGVVAGVIKEIVIAFDSLHTTFGSIAALLLQGEFHDAWIVFSNWAIEKLNDVKKFLPVWASDLITIVQNLLQGDWQGAWENAKVFVVDALNALADAIRGLGTPFTDFIADILQGKWTAAWEDAKRSVITVRDFIVDWLTNMHTPFTDFIADVLQGKWAQAWEDAKLSVIAVKDFIVQWLLDLHTPFTDWIALVLEGEWKDAWTIASNWAIEKLEELKKYVPPWGADVISVVQNLLKGDWATAWTDAKVVAGDVFTGITTWLDGLHTPFTSFISDILKGQWDQAWKDLKATLGLTDTQMTALLTTIGLLGGAIALMNPDLSAFVTSWIQAGGVIVPVIADIAGFISMAALLTAGLWLLSQPFADLHVKMETFRQNMMDLVNNTAIPAWLRGFFVDAIAISMAIEQWVRTLQTLGVNIDLTGQKADAVFGKNGALGGQSLSALQQLQMDVVEVAGMFEGLGLILEETALRAQIVWNALSNKSSDDAWKRIDEINKRLQDIGNLIRNDFSGTLNQQVTPLTHGLDILFGYSQDDINKRAAEDVATITTNLNDLRMKMNVQFLDAQQMAAVTGSGTIDAFAKAFVTPGSANAEDAVKTFINKISVLAAAIKNGYYNAGDDSVANYVKALADNEGIATDAAFALAQAIITQYGYGIDTVGGTLVPQSYEKNFVAPLIATQDPANVAGQGVGVASVGGVVTGTEQSTGSFMDTLTGLIGQAGGIYDSLVPKTTQTGTDSVTGMSTATDQAAPQATGSFQSLIDQATGIVNGLTPSTTQTGTDAVGGLGSSVEKGTQPALDIFGNLVSGVDTTTKPMVTNMGNVGTSSLQSFIMPYQEQAPGQLNTALNVLKGIFVKWGQDINDYMNLVGKAMPTNMANGIILMKGDLVTAANTMGSDFQTAIDGYIQTVINNFKNIADNARALIDFNKFTQLGTDIGNAIKSGIDASQAAATQAGADLVTAAQTGVTTTAQIASPSKLFQMLAHFIGDGFVLGLQDSLRNIQNATVQMVQEVAKTVQQASASGQLSPTVQAAAIKTTQGADYENQVIQSVMSKFMGLLKTGDIRGAESSLARGTSGLIDVEKGMGTFNTPNSLFSVFSDYLQKFDMFRKQAENYDNQLGAILDPAQKTSMQARVVVGLAQMFDQMNTDLRSQLSQKVNSIMSTNPANAVYNSTNSPVTIVNNIYNQMDAAQLQYMMQQTLNGANLA